MRVFCLVLSERVGKIILCQPVDKVADTHRPTVKRPYGRQTLATHSGLPVCAHDNAGSPKEVRTTALNELNWLYFVKISLGVRRTWLDIECETSTSHVTSDLRVVTSQHEKRSVMNLGHLAASQDSNVGTALGYDAFEQVTLNHFPIG